MPFLPAFEKKMSAKVGAIAHRNPKSLSAHAACSRLEPQPKFFPATRIFASLVAWIVDYEGWILVAGCGFAPIEEEKFAIAGAFDALQKLLRDDLIRIDVGAVERCDECCECAERFH